MGEAEIGRDREGGNDRALSEAGGGYGCPIDIRMVPLVTASSPMEAKVIAARLGAEGIVWELRGSVDGPLALGPIDVLVDADALDEAREMLLIDDVESSFDDRGQYRETTVRDVLAVAAILALVLLFALARIGARV